MSAAARPLNNPFPGLRPFGAGDAGLFFGRDRQADELLRRLGRQRLLAVVGTSGSGKSSLVHAGLLPALESGYMARAGTAWRVVGLRPQSDPIGSLASALCAGGALQTMALEPTAARSIIETTLRRSSLGLSDALRLLALPPGENLLVFVDQFEELFRYAVLARERGVDNDAAAFVQLLLQAVQQPDLPTYVVLTMRSDFLGDCARFRGLPEAISDGQYLVPRLSRDELRQAITGPVGVRGGRIDDALVQRLLNDVGDDPDQLPVLQHALMRAWDRWQTAGDGVRGLGLEDLEAIGGLAEALSRHADDAWRDELDDRGRALAARLFRCLTERVAGPREVRRPTALARLQTITGADADALERVIDVFRSPRRAFLMPPHGVALSPSTEIDISHESLIRQWKRLRGWVDEEWESRSMFLRLVQAVELQQAGDAGLWIEPALGRARRWVETERPVAAWADRYAPGLAQALAFVEASQAEWDRQQAESERKAETERAAVARELAQAHELAQLQAQQAEEQRLRLDEQTRNQRRIRSLFAILTLTLCVGLGVALWGWYETLQAEERALDASRLAAMAEGRAQQQSVLALAEKTNALAAREEARLAGLQSQAEVERMEKLIREQVRDPVLRERLLAQMPGAARTLNVAQQITRDSKVAEAATPARSDLAGARVPQAPGFKLWRNGSSLRVRFSGGSLSMQENAREAANEWARHANLHFRFLTSGEADIRVNFESSGSAWSYVGVDALGIPPSQPTMNLGFTDGGAALRLFGHVLGLIQEHQNPNARLPWNRAAVYQAMTGPPYFWDRATVDANMLKSTALAGYRDFDVDSVMMFSFPGKYFTDGVARGGKAQLSDSDKAFARRLYPPN